jgi:hypothetical protein
MRQMDAANFGRIAGELRVSSADLEALVRQGPHAADKLPKMLAALGIDQDDLARTEPLVLRDMERVCALCSQKRRCDRDLAAGTSAAHYQEYCANAPTMDGLGPAGEPTGRSHGSRLSHRLRMGS